MSVEKYNESIFLLAVTYKFSITETQLLKQINTNLKQSLDLQNIKPMYCKKTKFPIFSVFFKLIN